MNFAQRVMSGQVKTAGFGSFAIKAAPKIWSGLKTTYGLGAKGVGATGRWMASPAGVNTATAGAIGANLANNYVATRDWTKPIDTTNIAKSYDNTIRPAVGAAMLLGAPVAAYMMAKNTQTDDDEV